MDHMHKQHKENPRRNAGILSKLFSFWIYDVLKESCKNIIGPDNLWKPPLNDSAEVITDILQRAWEREIRKVDNSKKKPSLWRALIKVHGKKYVFLTISHLITELINIYRPYYIIKMLIYFDGDLDPQEALIDLIILSVLTVLYSYLYCEMIRKKLHFGTKIQSSLTSLMYCKCLKLSSASLVNTTPGQILNLVSNDVNRFERCAGSLIYIIASPVVVLLIIYFLYNEVGYSALAGFAFIVLMVPAEYLLCKVMKTIRFKTAAETDHRVKLMNEIIHGIQAIKMFSWEEKFFLMIKSIRKKEIKSMRRVFYLRGALFGMLISASRIFLFLLLVLYALSGNYLSPDLAFSVCIYAFLATHIGLSFPFRGFLEFGELKMCVKRVQDFLLLPEFSELKCKPKAKQNADVVVQLDNASVKWDPKDDRLTLRNLNFSVQKGELVGIFGSVGAGKSTLLQLLLNELRMYSGEVYLQGETSYASQEPWIFSASIRQNIVFGQHYDPMRYNNVISVCCLKHDIQAMPYGDQTLVGERGTTLSGGQKARVNLARAVYRNADIYLLDDTLSAVDAKVGKDILHNCILGHLENKTRIVVTHQLQFVNLMQKIIIMNNGQIEFHGTPSELESCGVDYRRLIINPHISNDAVESEIDHQEPEKATVASKERKRSVTDNGIRIRRRDSIISRSSIPDYGEETYSIQEAIDEKQDYPNHASIFFSFFLYANHFCFVMVLFLLFAASQLLVSGADYFVYYWLIKEKQFVSFYYQYDRINETNGMEAPHVKQFIGDGSIGVDGLFEFNLRYVYIYTAIMVVMLITLLTRTPAMALANKIRSTTLHDKVLRNVFSAPLIFFSDNTSGRILNRFSNDVGDVDDLLPYATMDFLQMAFEVIGAIILTVLMDATTVVLVVIVLVILYLVQKYYSLSFNNLRRSEGLSRSPVFSYLNSTLQGLSTIHCAKIDDTLKKEFNGHLDLNTSSRYLIIEASSAMGLLINEITAVYFIGVLVLFFITDHDNGISAGLLITTLIRFTSLIQYNIKQFIDLSHWSTSFERLQQYTVLDQEIEPSPKDILHVPANWPSEGRISFKNVYLRYKDEEPFILKNITLTISPMEKVGVVGRTGAGKSSLVNALFRLALVEGSIELDGVDTSKLRLSTLRSRISNIPQNPTLFSGTLRENLDPFSQYPDYTLINALIEVGFYEKVQHHKLQTTIAEEGNNFSIGERQLICLARALIRKNHILVMDEATANIDTKTDQQIQQVIRKHFRSCTVLTIAHRLHTVMDSDKILVMDSGRPVEFDHPYTLLCKPDSELRKLVNQTGSSTCQYLVEIAKQAYDRKYFTGKNETEKSIKL